MVDGSQEMRPQLVVPTVKVPDYVQKQLRERGLSSEELSFGENDKEEAKRIKEILDERKRAEENSRRVHNLEEAISMVGLKDVRGPLSKFETANPKDVKEADEALGDARLIESKVDYIISALHKVPKAMSLDRARSQEEVAVASLRDALINRYFDLHPNERPHGQSDYTEAMEKAQGEINRELESILNPVADKLVRIRELASFSQLEKNWGDLEKDIKQLQKEIKDIESLEILGMKFISTEKDPQTTSGYKLDLNKMVFDNYTVNRPDWYNEQNAQNMENAIIEAAKFAGGEFAPNIIDSITHKPKKGGKFAMYTQYEDGSIVVNLENLNEYIIYRIARHMAFQDPDDPIDVLQLRLFETQFRSVTFYEFFIHDAEKYAQKRTDEAGKTNPLYDDFLMYWALQASSSGHVYNSGIQARNVSNKEDDWKQFYDKLCRSDKLTAANRFPRELRKLSREDIKEQIALTGRLKYTDWVDYDGHLGQAISDYASLERYIFELSDNGWNIKQHLDAIDLEEQFNDMYAAHIMSLNEAIGDRTGYGQNAKLSDIVHISAQKHGPLLTLEEAKKRQGQFNKIIAGIQNGEVYFNETTRKWENKNKKAQGQNFFFKQLTGGQATREGRQAAIISFLTDLTNKYMYLELGKDSNKDVRDTIERVHAEGVSFIDLIRGTNLPQGVTQQDRNTIIRNLIIRGGLKRDTSGGFIRNADGTYQEAFNEARIKELAEGDFGAFVETLFKLEGNKLKKPDLNLFTSYGGVAKDSLKAAVTDSISEALARKFGNEATKEDKKKYDELIASKKASGETDKSKWNAADQALSDRVTNDLTAAEISYAYEAGKEISEWTMRASQNDTGVGGNRFGVRIAHPGQYFLNNLTNLNVGDKETIDLMRNTQDMLTGVSVSVQVTDKASGRSWRELMWLGEYMERGMYKHRQTRSDPQFGEHSLSVFFQRRVEAALKAYAAQRDPKNDVYNIGQYLVGYVLGQAEYSKGLENYTNNRNTLNDLLFSSKYPLPYDRLVREWVTEGEGKEGKKRVTCRTMQTEEYMLGKNVFLMEDIVMSNPDIAQRVKDGDWGRGQVLETMLELALVGETLKRKAYYYLPRHERHKYEAGTEGVLSAWGFKEAFEVMANSYIGKFGGVRKYVKTADGKTMQINEWEPGNRFTRKMAEDMFRYLSFISLEDMEWKEAKQSMTAGGAGFLMAFLGAIFTEIGKSLQQSLK